MRECESTKEEPRTEVIGKKHKQKERKRGEKGGGAASAVRAADDAATACEFVRSRCAPSIVQENRGRTCCSKKTATPEQSTAARRTSPQGANVSIVRSTELPIAASANPFTALESDEEERAPRPRGRRSRRKAAQPTRILMYNGSGWAAMQRVLEEVPPCADIVCGQELKKETADMAELTTWCKKRGWKAAGLGRGRGHDEAGSG